MNFDLIFNEIAADTEKEVALGLTTGKVTNNYDEEHLGMVQVTIAAYKEGYDASGWIRVASPMAGPDKGMYFLPEVGDEVLIGFINNNINYPCVIGCLWSDNETYPEEAVTEKNTVKKITTLAGHELIFNEEEGKESLVIHTPGKLTITLSDEEKSITIQDENGDNIITIDSEGGEVTINAATSITLESGDITLTASGDLTLSGQNVNIEAKSNATIEGKSKASVSGGMVSVESTGNLDLKASGMATLKGSMAKIN